MGIGFTLCAVMHQIQCIYAVVGGSAFSEVFDVIQNEWNN